MKNDDGDCWRNLNGAFNDELESFNNEQKMFNEEEQLYLLNYLNSLYPSTSISTSLAAPAELNSGSSSYSSVKSAIGKKRVLTEEEKRASHIKSEKNRRSNIQNLFNSLRSLLPDLNNVPNPSQIIILNSGLKCL